MTTDDMELGGRQKLRSDNGGSCIAQGEPGRVSQNGPLQILHLEDHADDTEIVRILLEGEKIPCELHRVQTRTDFETALECKGWNLIISDFALPSFDGMKALLMARQKCPNTPFILFSGTIGEEIAVESVKRGAADYVLKHRPNRLATAVRNAVQQAADRERVRQIEEELKKIAEREKELETRFLRMQRMESIGSLVSGMAHDLNNALVPVLLGCSFLRSEPPRTEAENVLCAIEKSARRGADMLKHVLAFARGIEAKKSAVQAKLLLREMQMIVSETFPKAIYFQGDFDTDLWAVSGDATQLHQVLMNLCINARDAMPQGGRLKLSARNVHVDKSSLQKSPHCQPGPYLALSVSDSGTGMPAEVLEKIFQPFFTTKDQGKGTGLGLSTALNIVKNHGGFMSVESGVGRGSTFHVYLPALNATVVVPEAEAKIANLPSGHGEGILLVDDEVAVYEFTKAALQNYGYRVFTAANGPEAVSLYVEKRKEIDLAVTDSDMPFMSGQAICMALRKLNPQLRLIMASGTEFPNGGPDTELRARVNAFVPKPYTLEKLLTTVHEVLEDPAAAPGTRAHLAV